MSAYDGPLRDEPPAIELHNTVYAASGTAADGLSCERGVQAWLSGMADRLPAGGTAGVVRRAELLAVREAIRGVLRTAADGAVPSREDVERLNEASARAPHHLTAVWAGSGRLMSDVDIGGATTEDVVLAALARDAIDLITGRRREGLRGCGAPGCVLLYLRSHPRQGWCSAACGNRARQARHYRRSRSGA